MTREEEIRAAAEHALKDCPYINTSLIGFDFFVKGAMWADAHQHWISVEDELPKNYEPVLAAFGSHFARVCFICGKSWYLDDPPVAEEMFDVTHWMPLPQPPKKGGEQ